MSLQDKLTSGKEKAAQQPFEVEILETLRMVVTVNAKDADEAEQIVRNAYGREEYVLDSGHHIGTDFLAEPAKREHSRGEER